MMSKAMWSVVLVVGVAAGAVLAAVNEKLNLDPDEWWGPEDENFRQNTTIWPYKIKFSSEMVHDLKGRLKNHRAVTPPLSGAGFKYGFNQLQIEPWVKYWTQEYDFEKRETYLNKYPQFQTKIQGLNIHFIWLKPYVPPGVICVPLLLLHGWPGSPIEYYETISYLSTPKDGMVFEMVVPSLPGYAFSDGAVRPGLGAAQIAVIIKNLMNRLGYEKFYIQGGDWGAIIGNVMATMFQEEVLGLHSTELLILNSCTELQTIMAGVGAAQMKPDQYDPLMAVVVEETGYMHILATKPDTIGIGLSDSPVALLAMIMEKFSTWTRIEDRALDDGGLSLHFTKEQLIDNVNIWWFTNCITTASRLYAEVFSNMHRNLGMDEVPTIVPIWKLEAANEKIFVQSVNMMKYPNLLGITRTEDGGHFFAYEMPELLAEDVFKAIKTFRKFHEDSKICNL